MTTERRNLFIIGSPKSGTTWLQIMIGAHPLVCTTVELTLFSKYTAPWIRAWSKEAANIEHGRWYQGLPFLWDEDEFYCFLRDFVAKVYARVLATNPEATHILDKHPGYSKHVDDINRLIPDARFIHIIRDGRDVVASMIAARKQIGYGAGTVSASATVWKEYVLAAREARKYDRRYMEIRYEDLLTSGAQMLKSVFDFCELPMDEEDITEIVEAHQFEKMKTRRQHPDARVKAHEAFYRKGQVGDWQGEFLSRDRLAFDRVAGDLLIELGYAEADWWVQTRGDRILLPLVESLSARKRYIRRGLSAIASAFRRETAFT